MNRLPLLYVGVAAPLLEEAQIWRAQLPDGKPFPRSRTGAYEFATTEAGELTFRTGYQVSVERVRQEMEERGGKLLSPLPVFASQPIPPIDHQQVLAALKQHLQAQPVQIISRIGLTRQWLMQDLSQLRPELVLLHCHGTVDGCLLFEDGRGRADFVPGERLFPLFLPRPWVLLLSACHSEAVLQRAAKDADRQNSAIIYIDAATPLEVGAGAAFQSQFYTSLLQGEAVGAAFESARQYLANDSDFGDLSVPSDEIPPSGKFHLHPGGESVRLPVPTGPLEAAPIEIPRTRRPRRLSRSAERFVGRRREMVESLDLLLPLPPGLHRGPEAGERRIVTLIREGGIGKTALALALADWNEERGLFPGGIFELACERFGSVAEWLSQLLYLLGVPLDAQRGDLLELLAAHLAERFPAERPVLLMLDNLDDLFSRPESREQASAVLETALTATPALRVLATCRWPLGLGDHETVVKVPPLDEAEARDVFLSHLISPAHKAEVHRSWERSNSSIRQLIALSGRHPQSLRLLARQLERPGMTLERLCKEARADLLKMLVDPLAADDERNRLKKVEASYELSYRHLSEAGRQLFERLSHLPGGIWCGQFPEYHLNWRELLGENWRAVLEKELDYYALVHYEPLDSAEGEGCFVMLPSMLEFARDKYRAAGGQDWEAGWIDFWRQRLGTWNEWIKGRVAEEMEATVESRGQLGMLMQQTAKRLFQQTQANWLAVFDALAAVQECPTLRWLLLTVVRFMRLSGQRVLEWELAGRAVAVMRNAGADEDLAPCLGTLGNVLHDLGEHPQARQAFAEALAIYRRLAQQHPAAYEPDVAMTLNNLGAVLANLGERPPARQALEEALAIRRRLAQQHPAAYEPDVAMTLNNLGTVLAELGERPQARQAYEEALELYRPFFEKWPQAFGQDFWRVLHNYIDLVEESEQDRWWQMWRSLQETADEPE